MEPFETENAGQPNAQQPDMPETAPAQEETGYYRGAGAGQRETVYGGGDYVSYHTDSAEPVQPAPEPPTPQQPKEKKHYGRKILKGAGLLILAAAMVIASSGITAGLTSAYWKSQYNTMLKNLNEKAAALQSQIDTLNQEIGESSGVLAPSDGALSAGEIYQRNVNSVVALTCAKVTTSNGQSYTATSAGTGFILTAQGHIVTNHHVIEDATAIVVTMADGTEYAAKLIGSDATNDVALIKIEAENLTPVTLGSSRDMQVGDQVVAIGNALGELSSSLTVGYISGTDRTVNTEGSVLNMLQMDAAINSGNSGGPLFNARGEVIGITTAKYSGTTTSGASIEGISFAIPVDDVVELLDDWREYGYIRSAYLGILVADVDSAAAEYYGFPVGAYVAGVEPGWCAEAAGLQEKDIILEVGGYEVTCRSDLSRALRRLEPGETVTIVVWRSGQELILTVTLDEKPH